MPDDSLPSLQEIVAVARSVRVVAGPEFNEQHRSNQATLLVESAEDALVALHGALMVDRASLAEQIALMSPGDITLAFFGQGHDLLTTCTYVHPGFLRWRPWGADARLADPDARPQGLLARGWQPPSTSVSESRA